MQHKPLSWPILIDGCNHVTAQVTATECLWHYFFLHVLLRSRDVHDVLSFVQ